MLNRNSTGSNIWQESAAKMVQQVHDSSDSSEDSVVEGAKVRQLTQPRSTDIKPKVQFADQQSMENKIDRLEKTLSELRTFFT